LQDYFHFFENIFERAPSVDVVPGWSAAQQTGFFHFPFHAPTELRPPGQEITTRLSRSKIWANSQSG